ncbi:hypothetical protein AT959_05470 [Dechloromonas denitrificans]|uniref:ABC-type transport auxiliary lipoprotein component domain-containing protein n=1 Tax=Dechloromonas denitrificans TaxID=281362 RepID=A0A133XLL1_9RHOO|nr:ABC-type transport auxiliary lipoprotein family protein [Dechloromonas denitrificans]KXB31796.1 hypothetical protein AT959_05470 [Dechloromonas denitrificans]
MIKPSVFRLKWLLASVLFALLGACGALNPGRESQRAFYSLDGAGVVDARMLPAPLPVSIAAPTLIVNPPHAAAGFDSQRIIYVREPHRLEYFANSEWADTPARMIAPLIVAALEKNATFRAILLTPSAAVGELRLDVEIVRLQHEFDRSPSQVRFTLRAYLIDTETRQVLAREEFDESVPAPHDTPYGGVIAANNAVQKVMTRLAVFCTEAIRIRRQTASPRPKSDN